MKTVHIEGAVQVKDNSFKLAHYVNVAKKFIFIERSKTSYFFTVSIILSSLPLYLGGLAFYNLVCVTLLVLNRKRLKMHCRVLIMTSSDCRVVGCSVA